MIAPPMRPWQNVLALAATAIAAGALLPIAGVLRLACAAAAALLIVLLLAARMRAHRVRRDAGRVDATYARIERIREERARRRR